MTDDSTPDEPVDEVEEVGEHDDGLLADVDALLELGDADEDGAG